MTSTEELVGDSPEPIVVADRGRIRFVILNRPAARNALTRAMRAEFSQVLSAADADPRIEGVVLTGAGHCFSAGVDLKDRVPGAPPVVPNPAEALRGFAKPLVAAIDGPCITGALEMALSCDFAIATADAHFADTHCKVGLFPRWGGGSLLATAIGVPRARKMMLAGERVDAQTALAWGLVTEITPAWHLLDRAMVLAATMAAQAAAHPRAYALHAQMLDSLARSPISIGVEQDMLDRFDQPAPAIPTLATKRSS